MSENRRFDPVPAGGKMRIIYHSSARGDCSRKHRKLNFTQLFACPALFSIRMVVAPGLDQFH